LAGDHFIKTLLKSKFDFLVGSNLPVLLYKLGNSIYTMRKASLFFDSGFEPRFRLLDQNLAYVGQT
jgi:hypothetical protein